MTKQATYSPKGKHLREIVLLFSVPIGIVAIMLAFLYVPRLFAHPTQDFIYCQGYDCAARYSVDTNGTIVLSTENDDASLYYYDARRDATKRIQPTEAKQYLLDASSRSSEGYVLQRRTGSSGFLFWSDYSDGWSLSKGVVTKPITLNGYDITFIGWVLQASWTDD